jgi:hypothetical protein
MHLVFCRLEVIIQWISNKQSLFNLEEFVVSFERCDGVGVRRLCSPTALAIKLSR